MGTQKKVYRQPNKAGAKMNADGYYADDAPDETLGGEYKLNKKWETDKTYYSEYINADGNKIVLATNKGTDSHRILTYEPEDV